MSWLDDFCYFGIGGECPPKYVFWTGVVTIAAVLRRKVWIDQINFQWTPNCYVLLVGPPGLKKTTSMNLGFHLLEHVPEIDLGPEIVTWPRLIEKMANAKLTYKIGERDFEASCVSIKVGEFGTFFDPLNRELVDNLTNIWDSNLGTIKKETKTNGCDEIVNPYLNLIAGTTPSWIEENFNTKLIGSGFASRPVYVYEEKPLQDVAYLDQLPSNPERQAKIPGLLSRLREYAELAGPFRMTKEAYEWGTQWYLDFRKAQRAMPSLQASFYERKQAHLHKLAMVLCVARGGWPIITAEDLQLAAEKMVELEPDVRMIFSKVGRTRLSTVAATIVDTLKKTGPMKRSALFLRFFFQTMSSEEFEIALRSVQQSGQISMSGSLDDMLISLKDRKAEG